MTGERWKLVLKPIPIALIVNRFARTSLLVGWLTRPIRIFSSRYNVIICSGSETLEIERPRRTLDALQCHVTRDRIRC